MLADTHINEHLTKTKCYNCGVSLERARLTPLRKAQISLVAHAVCQNCLSESILTITFDESGSMPISSDLKSSELSAFMGRAPTSYDEIFEIHEALKKKPIWKLLQKKEKSLESKIKA